MQSDVLFALISLLSTYIDAHEGNAPHHLDFEGEQYDVGDVLDAALALDPAEIPAPMADRTADALDHVGGQIGAVVCCAIWRTTFDFASGDVPANAGGFPGLMTTIGALLATHPLSDAAEAIEHLRNLRAGE